MYFWCFLWLNKTDSQSEEIRIESYLKLEKPFHCSFPRVNPRRNVPNNPSKQSYTQRNLFEILLNQTEIRLYSPFSDWFGTKRISVWFQINRKIVNTIWFQFDLTRFGKDFSVCSFTPNNKVPHVTLKASDETGSRKLNSIKMDWRCNLSPDCKTYGFF